MSTHRLLQNKAVVKIKGVIRALVEQYPFLMEFLLSQKAKRVRRLIYRFFPHLANFISARLYARGDIKGARHELEAADITWSVVEKFIEIDRALDEGVFPRPAPPSHISVMRLGDAANISVVHALYNSLPIDQAGYAHRSQALLKAQTERGIAVFPYTRPGYPHDLSRPKDTGCADTAEIEGIVYRQLDPASSLRSTATTQEYIASYATGLAEKADLHQAGIIHGHSNYLNGLAAAWAAKWTGCQSVYEARGLWHVTRGSLDPAFKQSPLFRFHQILELEAMHQVDAIVTLSSPLRQWMIEHDIPSQKIHLVRNAIDIETASAPPLPKYLVEQYGLAGKTVIGYAGSLVAYEGLDLLIKALAVCLRNGENVALVIVGDGVQRKQLMDLTRQLGLKKHVHFVGRVNPADIPDYLSLFDICPLPRLDLPVCRLVPPLKPLEIMAFEKPLIVSALPPLLEFGVEGQSRISFTPDNVDDLAGKISMLAKDAKLRETLGKHARQWVSENGSWKLNADKYANLYAKILRNSASG